MNDLDAQINEIEMPPIKFSSDLLNKKYKLKFLIKSKNYTQAKEIQQEIKLQEEKETETAFMNMYKTVEKMKDAKRKKHNNESEAVKARLEKSINSKLKQRMEEYEKLLLRIQNCHNDLMNRQSVQFGRIQSIHAKLLSKYNLNIDDFSSRYEDNEYHNIEQGDEQEQEYIAHDKNHKEKPKETFSKHLESSSQGDLKIDEVNYEQEYSEKEEIQQTENELNTQGQINGYWKQENVEDFDIKNSSEKYSHKFNETFDNIVEDKSLKQKKSEKKKIKKKNYKKKQA